MNNKHYTEEDILFLKSNYLEKSDEQLAEHFNKTVKSVSAKRHRLGLLRFEMEKVNTIKGEIWKPVVGFEEKYLVSNKGRVQNTKGGLLVLYLNAKGYVHFFASISKTEHKTYRVQRAVALAFIPNTDNKPEVNHLDFNKLNNETHNLEWCTRQENMDHWANSL